MCSWHTAWHLRLQLERIGNKEKTVCKSEPSSLGVDCKRKNELNDKEELEALATAIKEVYFQDYKTAYDDDDIHKEIDKSHFGHLI